MPIPETAGASPLTLALGAAGAIVAFLAMVGKYIGYVVKGKTEDEEKVRLAAEKVELDRRALRVQDDQYAREESNRLFEERKQLGEQYKADNASLRSEFSEKMRGLETRITAESEERAMVQVSANAAIDRANEANDRANDAIRKLAAAKTDRDEITAKLHDVEQRATRSENRTEQVEREKNIEIESLRAQLREANHNIEVLQTYIRDHKLTVSLTQGEQVITASMEPAPPAPEAAPDEPPTRDTDF